MEFHKALSMAYKYKLKVRRSTYKEGQYFTVEDYGPINLYCFDQNKKPVKFKLDNLLKTDWETFK